MTKLTYPISDDFLDVLRSDSLVAAGVEAGLSLEDIIVLLVKNKNDLFQRLLELDRIAPFKIRTEDGMMIWRCPDEFVPERGINL